MASSPTPHYFYRSTGHAGLEFVRPSLGSFNLMVAERAQAYPKHRHRNYPLILAPRGRYRCGRNETRLELRPREVLIVKRGDWHEDLFASRLRGLAVNFDLAGRDVRGSGSRRSSCRSRRRARSATGCAACSSSP